MNHRETMRETDHRYDTEDEKIISHSDKDDKENKIAKYDKGELSQTHQAGKEFTEVTFEPRPEEEGASYEQGWRKDALGREDSTWQATGGVKMVQDGGQRGGHWEVCFWQS